MFSSRFKQPVRWSFLAVLCILLVCVWQYRSIHDWFLLRSYTPSASVIQLVDDVQLTPNARKLFYVNHPTLQDRAGFNITCVNQDKHTIVLGCYHPVDRGIFIFKVTDSRLTGVDQVTAAHEMLHAAYDRLSRQEQARIDGLLQSYYTNDLKDERIKAIIAAYMKSEPNDVVNEMHSVFGTEVAALPSGLESYYQRYFKDRFKVAAYANAYQAEFTSRQAQVASYDARLKDMQQRIDVNTADLDAQKTHISVLRQKLDSTRASGDIETYNQNVPIYNARIDVYNSLITTTKSLTASYNQMVQDRNDLALQVADLARSIDSSLQQIN